MKLTLVLAYPFHYRIICTNVHFFFEESFYKFVSVALYTVYLCSLEVVYVSAIQTSKCIWSYEPFRRVKFAHQIPHRWKHKILKHNSNEHTRFNILY
jgi:hypothetical protein